VVLENILNNLELLDHDQRNVWETLIPPETWEYSPDRCAPKNLNPLDPRSWEYADYHGFVSKVWKNIIFYSILREMANGNGPFGMLLPFHGRTPYH
jgi:hypothetical protein